MIDRNRNSDSDLFRFRRFLAVPLIPNSDSDQRAMKCQFRYPIPITGSIWIRTESELLLVVPMKSESELKNVAKRLARSVHSSKTCFPTMPVIQNSYLSCIIVILHFNPVFILACMTRFEVLILKRCYSFNFAYWANDYWAKFAFNIKISK